MNTKAITIRTEDETIDQIDSLAKAMDRSRNYVVNQAMLAYVANANAKPEPALDPPPDENGAVAAPAAPAPAPPEEVPTPKKAAKSSGKKKKDKKKKKKARKKSKK